MLTPFEDVWKLQPSKLARIDKSSVIYRFFKACHKMLIEEKAYPRVQTLYTAISIQTAIGRAI